MSDLNDSYTTLGLDAGNEVEGVIKQLENLEVRCCDSTFVVGNTFNAYPHDNGVMDGNGTKWWLFVDCPICGHSFSHNALLRILTIRRNRA